MTKENLELLLRSYESNKFLLKTNKINIAETIEAICLSSQCYDNAPPSVTNKFNSKTENAVIMIDSEIKQQRDVIKHIQNAVLLVDYLLRHSLNAKQRLIIKRFYISEQTWREIAHTYEQKYRVNYISRVRLKQIQKQALDKMLENIDKAHKQLI